MSEFIKTYRIAEEIMDKFNTDTVLPICRKVADELYGELNVRIVQ